MEQTTKKYKQRHDQHKTPHNFQVGDKVWLHLQKEHLQGPHRKIHHLLYGPYKIIKKVGENAFELNLPPFLGVHPVFNVELLKPYFPPLLDIADVAKEINHIELNLEVVSPLQNDQIVEVVMKNLRNQKIYLYHVMKAGQFIQQGKWLTLEQIQLHFPHLMQSLDEMGPISSQGGRNDQNIVQEDAEGVGTSKNEKIPKSIFLVFSMF